MSRQFLLPGLLLLAFIAGAGFGLSLEGAFSSSPVTPAKTAGPTSSKDTFLSEAQTRDRHLEDRVQELEKALAEQKKNQDALTMQDRLSFFKKYGQSFFWHALDDDLKVSPMMVDLLKLSPQEKEALEQQLAEARKETQAIEDAKMTMVRSSTNSITYTIPAYPEGKEIKARLISSLTNDLDETRAELFLSSGTLDRLFSDFGQQKTQVTITQNIRNGVPRYDISENFSGPNGSSGSSQDSPILPKRWERLQQYEPQPGQ